MPNGTDGTITFSTKIDTSGMDVGMLKIENKANKATNAVSKQTQAVQKLEAEMQRLKTTQVPTEQYAQLDSAMQKADTRLMSLIDTQDKYLATGGATHGTYWNRLQYDIEKASSQVREYQAQMTAMQSDGSAFTQDSAAIRTVSTDLDTAKIKLQELQIKEKEAAVSLVAATSPKNPEAMAAATNKASKSMTTFGKRIASVLRSALIFTVITQLAAKFRDYIGEASVSNDEFRTALGKLKGALKSAFAPIFTAILPALTSLTNALAKAISYITQFISLIFGASSGSGTAKLQSATVSLMGTAEGTTEALVSETASLQGLSSAADDAEKSMADFDEIKQLGNKDSSGGGGSDTTIPTLTPDAVELPSWLVDYAERLAKAFEKIKDSAERLSKSQSFKTLATLLKGLAAAGVVGTVEGIARGFESLAGSFETIDKFTSGDFGGGLKAWLKSVWDLLTSVLNPFRAVYQILETIALFIVRFIQSLNLKEWWDAHVAPILDKAKQMGEDIKLVFKGIVEFVSGVFTGDWERAWNGVQMIISGAKEFISDKLELIKMSFALLTSPITNVLSQISYVIQSWVANLKLIFNGVITFLKGVFTGDWKLAWSGLVDIFKGYLDTIASTFYGTINFIIEGINWLIDGLNWLISGLNTVKSEASGWLGGGTGGGARGTGISFIPKIPQLAEGAVIPANREFLAVLGDQKSGTNIEAPLDTIVAAFRQVMREGSGSKGEAVMEVDGQAFGRLVYKYGNNETKRVGVRLAGA